MRGGRCDIDRDEGDDDGEHVGICGSASAPPRVDEDPLR
jgi:hypothetical protein